MASAKQQGGKTASAAGNAVVIILLTLTAVGIGLAAGGLSPGHGTESPAHGKAAPLSAEMGQAAPESASERSNGAAHGGEPAEGEAPGDLPQLEQAEVKPYPFPPVLTALAAPKGTWIRIEGSMLVDVAAAEVPEILVEQAATNLLGYLRSVELHQIEGPNGLLFFRQDINELVSALSSGQVREVLIHTLVVE